jgi:hypothetical protein
VIHDSTRPIADSRFWIPVPREPESPESESLRRVWAILDSRVIPESPESGITHCRLERYPSHLPLRLLPYECIQAIDEGLISMGRAIAVQPIPDAVAVCAG